jgi:hypothetical protein
MAEIHQNTIVKPNKTVTQKVLRDGNTEITHTYETDKRGTERLVKIEKKDIGK